MATATGYRKTDFAHVRQTIFAPSWTPSLPSATWAGIVPEGGTLVPDPAKSTDSTKPTVYAAWNLRYDTVEGDYGGTSAPVRYGKLNVAGYIEKGALPGPLEDLRSIILTLLDAAPDDPIGFTVQEADVVTNGYIGSWFVQTLVVPFCGG